MTPDDEQAKLAEKMTVLIRDCIGYSSLMIEELLNEAEFNSINNDPQQSMLVSLGIQAGVTSAFTLLAHQEFINLRGFVDSYKPQEPLDDQL